jgi:hypothetical protein
MTPSQFAAFAPTAAAPLDPPPARDAAELASDALQQLAELEALLQRLQAVRR